MRGFYVRPFNEWFWNGEWLIFNVRDDVKVNLAFWALLGHAIFNGFQQ